MANWSRIAASIIALAAVILAITWFGRDSSPDKRSVVAPGEAPGIDLPTQAVQPKVSAGGSQQANESGPAMVADPLHPDIVTYEERPVMTPIGNGGTHDAAGAGVSASPLTPDDHLSTAQPGAEAREAHETAPGMPGYVDPRSPEASGSGITGLPPEVHDTGVPSVAPEMYAPSGTGIAGDLGTAADPSISGPDASGQADSGLPPEAYDSGVNAEPPEGSD